MQAPRAEGLRPRIASKNIQASIAAADAVLVVANASAAVLVGRQRRPRVEAEPAEPEHARAEQHERDVGGHVLAAVVEQPAPAEDERARQRGEARRHVDDGAAGEVEHAPLAQEAVGMPRPVRERAVDEQAEEHA